MPAHVRRKLRNRAGHIAGGYGALIHAAEGAEDDADAGAELIDSLDVNADDTVIGISASGGARYVIAAVKRARGEGRVYRRHNIKPEYAARPCG